MNVPVVPLAIDGDELAVRIAEAMIEAARPAGYTARQVVDAMPEPMRGEVIRAANAIGRYIIELALAQGMEAREIAPLPAPQHAAGHA